MSRRSIDGAVITALALALGAGAGCGSEPEMGSTGTSMVAPAAVVEPQQANHPPELLRVTLSPSSPQSERQLRAQVDVHDPDGDAIRLTYTWSVNGQTVPAQGAGHTLAPRELHKGDRVAVDVVATDGRLESTPARAEGTVGNLAPTVTALRIAPEGDVTPGMELSAEADGDDPDGDLLQFDFVRLVADREVGTGRTLSTDSLRRGDEVRVRVVARDGSTGSEPVTSVALPMANRAPILQGVPRAQERDGVFTYQFEAKDPDGDRGLRYRLDQAPAGMSIDPVLGTAIWRPAQGQVGVHPVEVVVEDKSGDGSRLQFEVRVAASSVPSGGSQPPAGRP